MKDTIRDRRNQLRIAVAKRINSQVTVLTEDRKQKQIQVCRVLSYFFNPIRTDFMISLYSFYPWGHTIIIPYSRNKFSNPGIISHSTNQRGPAGCSYEWSMFLNHKLLTPIYWTQAINNI